MKIVPTFSKRVLIPLGLTATADAGIHKKVLGSEKKILVSNEEIDGIMKIVLNLLKNQVF